MDKIDITKCPRCSHVFAGNDGCFDSLLCRECYNQALLQEIHKDFSKINNIIPFTGKNEATISPQVSQPACIEGVPGVDTRTPKQKAAMDYSLLEFVDYTNNPQVAQANMRMMAFSAGWEAALDHEKSKNS